MDGADDEPVDVSALGFESFAELSPVRSRSSPLAAGTGTLAQLTDLTLGGADSPEVKPMVAAAPSVISPNFDDLFAPVKANLDRARSLSPPKPTDIITSRTRSESPHEQIQSLQRLSSPKMNVDLDIVVGRQYKISLPTVQGDDGAVDCRNNEHGVDNEFVVQNSNSDVSTDEKLWTDGSTNGELTGHKSSPARTSFDDLFGSADRQGDHDFDTRENGIAIYFEDKKLDQHVKQNDIQLQEDQFFSGLFGTGSDDPFSSLDDQKQSYQPDSYFDSSLSVDHFNGGDSYDYPNMTAVSRNTNPGFSHHDINFYDQTGMTTASQSIAGFDYYDQQFPFDSTVHYDSVQESSDPTMRLQQQSDETNTAAIACEPNPYTGSFAFDSHAPSDSLGFETYSSYPTEFDREEANTSLEAPPDGSSPYEYAATPVEYLNHQNTLQYNQQSTYLQPRLGPRIAQRPHIARLSRPLVYREPMILTPVPECDQGGSKQHYQTDLQLPGRILVPTFPSQSVPTRGYQQERQIARHESPHPVVSFGFGGKVLTVFPRLHVRLNAFDQSPRRRNEDRIKPGYVNIRRVATYAENNPLIQVAQLFPGPLTASTPSEKIVSFIDSIVERTSGESTKLLWLVLKVWVVHGDAFCSDDLTKRQSLTKAVLRVINESRASQEGAWMNDTNTSLSGEPPLKMGRVGARTDEDQVAHRMQHLCLTGDYVEALQLGLINRLWPHVFALASRIDPAIYARAVAQYARETLNEGTPLETLYLLLSGDPQTIFGSVDRIFQERGPDVAKEAGVLRNWRQNVAILVGAPTRECSAALTRLGELLEKICLNTAGAHLCYMLAGSALNDPLKPRVSLLGSDNVTNRRAFVSVYAVQRTEIYEYVQQGSATRCMYPHLQVYKFVYACSLVDLGVVNHALDYMSTIIESVKHTDKQLGSAYSRVFLNLLAATEERLKTVTSGGGRGKKQGVLNSLMNKFAGMLIGQEESSSPGPTAIPQVASRASSPAPVQPPIPLRNAVNPSQQDVMPSYSGIVPSPRKNAPVRNSLAQSQTAPSQPAQSAAEHPTGETGFMGKMFGGLFGGKKKQVEELKDETQFYYDSAQGKWICADGTPPAPSPMAQRGRAPIPPPSRPQYPAGHQPNYSARANLRGHGAAARYALADPFASNPPEQIRGRPAVIHRQSDARRSPIHSNLRSTMQPSAPLHRLPDSINNQGSFSQQHMASEPNANSSYPAGRPSVPTRPLRPMAVRRTIPRHLHRPMPPAFARF